ncbi:hypothetical protein LINGRAHAP2_LOCUS4889 [Linum grandiflorum]
MTDIADKKPFPEADVDKELNPGQNKRVEPDSSSSDIATNKVFLPLNEKAEAVQKKNTCCGGNEKKDCRSSGLKKTVIISVIVAAVAAAAFGITKKLREKQT